MRSLRLNGIRAFGSLSIFVACSSSGSAGFDEVGAGRGGEVASVGGTSKGGAASSSGGASGSGGTSSTNGGGAGKGGATGGGKGGVGAIGSSGEGGDGGDGGASEVAAGWLYTEGNKILVSDENGTEKQWVGRGVNIDDIYFCGYNFGLWMDAPEDDAKIIVNELIDDWKPNFVRVSLAMASFDPGSSWLGNPDQYKTPMTSVINAIGAHPNTYALVSLRSDESMIGHYPDGPEPTGIPSDATTTPNATKFPTGTDAVYVALVNSFANSSFVMFGLTNEPGGNSQSNATIRKAMSHAIDVIRAEEDRLGVPHHVVAVQGNGWSSEIEFYADDPLPQDNVIYEVHGYPPPAEGYTFANIPVFIGEYGGIGNGTSFYADLESKKISSLAWDLDPYSDCSPDLVEITQESSPLQPNAWGNTVRTYLRAHAGQ